MAKKIIVINAGSSSIKFTVYTVEADEQLLEDCQGQIQPIGHRPAFMVKASNGERLVDHKTESENANHDECLAIIFDWLVEYLGSSTLLGIGHRVVHGGVDYLTPVLVDDRVMLDLEKLNPLAPLHQPHNLAAIRACQELMPEIPQIACFDTFFHRSQPEIAQYTGLPRHYFEAGIRRYGFHGLSFEYTASILASLQAGLSESKVVIAHLGNGASLCALEHGRSLATTMGFSPLDGLLMGTRCGRLDPGVLLYLLQHEGMPPEKLERLLYNESGLLGVSGISGDMRDLFVSDDPKAAQAVELFIYTAVREIAALAGVLEGLDMLVFTGGIGENSPIIRERICRRLTWLGLALDTTANQENHPTKISAPASAISAWVVKADENLIIARKTLQLC